MTDPLPTALYTATQVRELDARLIGAGTPGFELMQRAAHACWRALRRRWPDAGTVTVLAGSGNNAGDGYLVATLAQRAGWQVKVVAVGEPQALKGDAAKACAEARQAGVVIEPWRSDSPLDGVLVDALLGTGLTGAVRPPYAQAIEAINESGRPVLAVDIPSGLCADTGALLGHAVRAEVTVTFIGLKLGLFTGEGPDRVGQLVFDDLQAEQEQVAAMPHEAVRLCPDTLPRLAPSARPRTRAVSARCWSSVATWVPAVPRSWPARRRCAVAPAWSPWQPALSMSPHHWCDAPRSCAAASSRPTRLRH